MNWLVGTARAAEEVGYEESAGFFANEYLWLTVGLILFIAAIWRMGGFRSGLGALDKRIEQVRGQLDEAEKLKEEAQALLAKYQRDHRDALKEAEDIVAQANAETARFREKAEKDLAASIARREAQARDRIAQAEAQALRDIRNAAIDVAMSASRNALAEKLDEPGREKLVQQALDELPQKLN